MILILRILQVVVQIVGLAECLLIAWACGLQLLLWQQSVSQAGKLTSFALWSPQVLSCLAVVYGISHDWWIYRVMSQGGALNAEQSRLMIGTTAWNVFWTLSMGLWLSLLLIGIHRYRKKKAPALVSG